MRSGTSLATVLLAGRLVGEGLQPLKASEFWLLQSRVGDLSMLLGQTELELGERYGLGPELAGRVAALLDRATGVAFELERLEQSGIHVVTPSDDHYPPRFITRLAAKAPPVLYATGHLDLLRRPGLGVVGSRDVSDEGAEVAWSAGELAAHLGFSVVSGGARGVDQIAMDAAAQAGETAVGVLAESLIRRLKDPDTRRAVSAGSTVLCTPYGPDAPFSAGRALGRNKLIYAQSRLAFVVAAESGKGGSWAGATDALEGRFARVAVWRGPGEGPGNRQLQDQGAAPVKSLEALANLLLSPESERSSFPPGEGSNRSAEQASLFDVPRVGPTEGN